MQYRKTIRYDLLHTMHPQGKTEFRNLNRVTYHGVNCVTPGGGGGGGGDKSG